MNEKNVAALAAIIRDIQSWPILPADGLAEAFASRGVLVPAALDREQAWRIGGSIGSYQDYPSLDADRIMRDVLERIARGEP